LQHDDPNSNQKLKVDIPIGSSSSTIAKTLEDHGIIKDQLVFRLYTKLKNTPELQAGEYTFTTSMSVAEIIESLKIDRVVQEPTYRVTIPEVTTLEEIDENFYKYVETIKNTIIELRDKRRKQLKKWLKFFPNIFRSRKRNFWRK